MRVVSERAWRVAVTEDVSSFMVTPAEQPLRLTAPALGPRALPAENCTVEVLWRITGMMPHGMVAATFEPRVEQELQVEVPVSTGFSLSQASSPGPLGSTPLICGLPHEFASAVLEGIANGVDASTPRGSLRVVGGGYEVDSSQMIFRLCGRIMLAVAVARSAESDVGAAIRNVLRSAG